MSHRIIVLDEAEDELIAAQRWYENQRAGLGQEFRKAIDDAALPVVMTISSL